MQVKEIRDIETNELTGYLVDGMSVPLSEGNRHYREVVQYIADGGIVEEAYTEEERLNYLIDKARTEVNNAIQNLLDTTAQSLRYDNIMSARSYTGYVNPFQTEAQTLAVWAANCWVKAGQIEADVVAGPRAMPTVDEVLAELPVYGA